MMVIIMEENNKQLIQELSDLIQPFLKKALLLEIKIMKNTSQEYKQNPDPFLSFSNLLVQLYTSFLSMSIPCFNILKNDKYAANLARAEIEKHMKFFYSKIENFNDIFFSMIIDNKTPINNIFDWAKNNSPEKADELDELRSDFINAFDQSKNFHKFEKDEK